MQGKYKVITLCGSTRFKDEFLRIQKKLTLEGHIVISVGLFGHSGDKEVWDLDNHSFEWCEVANLLVKTENGFKDRYNEDK